jgi:hypothetical protein
MRRQRSKRKPCLWFPLERFMQERDIADTFNKVTMPIDAAIVGSNHRGACYSHAVPTLIRTGLPA